MLPTPVRYLAFSLLIAASSTAGAQPRVAADLNVVGDGVPADAVLYDGRLFFAATNRSVGRELWVFDPATGDIELAADILPGSNLQGLQGSYPHSLTVFGDELFFGIIGEERGELWAYRADSGEARFVSDIRLGVWFAGGMTGPGYLAPLDGRLYYAGNGDDVGVEVWAYDPATDDVSLVVDVATGTESSDPAELVVYDERLYFSAAPFGHIGHRELFAYDPSTGQTVAAAPDGIHRFPEELTVYDDRLYFVSDASGTGTIWATDGSSVDLVYESSGSDIGPQHLVVYDDQLFFNDTDADGFGQWALWATDGGPATALVPAWVRTEPVVYDGRLFFGGLDGSGEELWVFDAATGQASIVTDLNTASSDASSYPDHLSVVGGRLYFAADDGGAHGRELWSYDAGTDEVALAADIESSYGSSPASLTALDGRLYFRADAGDEVRAELWSYDPASGHAGVVADLRPDGASRPEELAVHQGVLYFSADGVDADGTDRGRELWAHDPATGETRLVVDLAAGSANGSPRDLVSYAGRLYFRADDSTLGGELWVYNPDIDEVTLAADIRPGADGSWPEHLTVVGERLYFSADDGVHGPEVWVYDAATGQAALALDAVPGSDGSYPQWLAAYAGELVVQAEHGSGGSPTGLWVIDPADGAARFIDLGAIPAPQPNGFGQPTTLYDGRLLFHAYDADTMELGLWAYVAASATAAPLGAFDTVSEIELQHVYEDRLYVSARTPEVGQELWAYDAADESLELVGDLVPGPGWSLPADFAVAGGRLFFRATDFLRGDELWVYEGPGGVAAEESARDVRVLSAPAPNPTRGRARITFQMNHTSDALVALYDVLGREVLRIHDGPLASGPHNFSFDAASLSPGLYVVRARAGGLREARALTVVR